MPKNRRRHRASRLGRTAGMTRAPDPTEELNALREEVAHLRRVNRDLLDTMADLRGTHIDRLARMNLGRRSEWVAGPTQFDPPVPRLPR